MTWQSPSEMVTVKKIISIISAWPVLVVLLLEIIFALSLDSYQSRHDVISPDLLGKKSEFVGVIDHLTVSDDGFTRLIINLTKRLSPYQENISGRIQLTIGEACGNNVVEGNRLTFTAKLKAPTSYLNPGVFDYATFLRRKGIGAKAFVKGCDDVVADSGFVSSSFRERLISNLYVTQDDGRVRPRFQNTAMMVSLLTGAKTLSHDQSQKVRDAGLSHLFAISGMQFGVMSLMVFALVAWGTGFFPRLYLKMPRQKIASGATIVFALFYLKLVDGEPSIVRAGLMIITYLLAVILNLRTNLLYTILLSACVLLFFAPLELFSLSFQLSYLCVIALAVVLGPLFEIVKQQPWFERRSVVTKYILGLLAISLGLQIMLAPLVIYEFGVYSLAGVIHNLWAVPYFDFIVTPLSFIYIIVSAFSTHVALFVAGIWDHLLSYFLVAIDWFDLDGKGVVSLFMPHFNQVIVFYSVIIFYFLTKNKNILIGGTLVLSLLVGYSYYSMRLGFDLRITQIDVGQGDSQLIQAGGKNVLIDTGGSVYQDLGQMVLVPFFKYKWLGTLDAVVITHADVDHYGALASLADSIKIGEVWVNGYATKDTSYQQLIGKLKEKSIPIKEVCAGDEYKFDAHTKMTVLSQLPGVTLADNDNDNAIVLRLVSDSFSGLFTGDISKSTERVLVEKYADALNVDYLKLAHHGSRTSSSSDFLAAVSPSLVTVGVGRPSRFGHPHRDVLGRIDSLGYPVKIYRTDESGAVEINIDGGVVSVGTEVE